MKDNIEYELPYLRIGVCYYKIIKQPLASKDQVKKIIPWNGPTITEDHGVNYKREIIKYDSFCNIPDNINYQRVVGNSYNMYEPIDHDIKPGQFEIILSFIRHIFGDQFTFGLDYLTIIWRNPTQILPILCLVSLARNTGKTTFLNFLKDIFGDNMTINTNEDFRNQFNSGWTSKLLIGVDEVLLDRKEDTERLKYLSTTRSIKSESKGKDKIEQEFYGKFILCANDESDFIKISPNETRYWIRKIPTIANDNIELRLQMQKEIPFFLHFLTNRKIETENKTRMWFTREQLYTDALHKVINGVTTKLEKEIKNLIVDQLFISTLDFIHLTPKDLIWLLKTENNVSVSSTDITNIISEKWGYKPETKSKYYKKLKLSLTNDGNIDVSYVKGTGRYYTFEKNKFCEM